MDLAYKHVFHKFKVVNVYPVTGKHMVLSLKRDEYVLNPKMVNIF